MRAMETVFSPSHFRAISNHHNFSLTRFFTSLTLYIHIYVFGLCIINVQVCFFREQTKLSSSNQKICKGNKKFVVCCCESSKPISQNGFYRRDIVLFGIGATVASVFPVEGIYSLVLCFENNLPLLKQ